jgi:hypothetical protein
MTAPFARAALDGIAARLAAILLAAAVAAVLVWINRDRLFPSEIPEETAGAPPSDPFEACMGGRTAEIERMVAEKTIDAERGELFRARNEAICRAEADRAAGRTPGLPPGLTPTQQF